jgi:hypothetical protein
METTTREATTPEAAAETLDETGSLSRRKRVGISMLIVLTLVAILASNAPNSLIKEGLLHLTRPYLLATGLDQSWGVFAPNPPRATNNVVARIDRADGSVGVVPMENGGGLTEYWDYRWRKYAEQLWQQQGAERERVAFARWLADQDRASGHQPVRVTLLRSTRALPPPGEPADPGPWQEISFFTLPVSTP